MLGAGTAIGVTATPRSFFLDVKIGNTANGPQNGIGLYDAGTLLEDCVNGTSTKVSTWNDTTLMVDKSIVFASSYTMQDYDAQIITGNTVFGPYAGWWDANGREILFIDEAQSGIFPWDHDQQYMIPTRIGDLVNSVGRMFVYTRDTRNITYVNSLRDAGKTMFTGGRNGYNWITDPYWHPNITPGPNGPNNGPYPHIWSSPSIGAEFSGLPYVFGGPPSNNGGGFLLGGGIGTAAGGLRYGRNAPLYDWTNVAKPNISAGMMIYSMTQQLYNFITSDITGQTYNPLCTWMYAEAVNGVTGTKAAVTGNYLAFYPFWKKAAKVQTGDNWDFVLRKQISLNLGQIRYGTGAWQDLDANLTALGAAWTYARDSASVDFSFTYPTPAGYAPDDFSAGKNLSDLTIASKTGNSLDHAVTPYIYDYFTTLNQRVPFAGPMNCYDNLWVSSTAASASPVGTPGSVTPAVLNRMRLRSFFNTWISLNNNGSWPVESNGSGIGNGSGPINDYGKNHSDGGIYDVTPPAMTFDHWTHYNGKQAYTNTNVPYGLNSIPAPPVDANYPWGGIVIRNGIIYVNYYIANGGSISRCGTRLPWQAQGYEGPAVSYMYTSPY
ncbi:MAG: hypothetical protein IPH58_09675 [Sphingobacteriales bacterium]|nr:hypothetical protein [Sphingobacteriales bacterium]